ncbi:hypothetical protein G7054_g6189 [Neopestalotiopsis clavispora]|nr:hypothetical protein G7054_g6189 [Neopestalotiopsis clavispora]
MAEVLGAVASGIALAEIAVKLKSLLSQISDAPETLESLVNQVDVYAGMLNGLDFDDVLESDIPRSLHASLRAAALQCQNAVNQLSLVVKDLSALGKTSFRRRKMVAIRFVLQKDSIVQFERRLQTAVQCLALAHQLYALYVGHSLHPAQILIKGHSAWQKTQLPDMIVSRLLSEHLSFSPKASLAIRGSVSAPVMNAWSEPASGHADKSMSNYASQTRRAAQLPAASGGEMLYFGPDGGNEEDTTWVDCSQSPGQMRPYHKANSFQRKLRLPAWSSSYVFEIFAQRSYTGWKASFAFYNVYAPGSTHYQDAYRLIRSNDDRKIYQALELRKFSIHDRFLAEGYEHSFAEFAWAAVSWKSCNYFLDTNPQQLNHITLDCFGQEQNEESGRQLEIFLKRDELPDPFPFVEFINFVGDGASFDRLRKQLWADEEFYGESFITSRSEIASELACFSDEFPSTHKFFRNAISPEGRLRSQDIFTGHFPTWKGNIKPTLLHALAAAISAITWRVLKDANHKQSLAYLNGTSQNSKPFIETAMRDDWALVVSEVVPIWNDLHCLVPGENGFDDRTALYWDRSRSTRFLLIEPGLRLWLNILRNAGVDLKEYGKKEAGLFISQSVSEKPVTMYDVTFGDRLSRIHGGDAWGAKFEVNLIGFQYGAEVDDWKLWWSEPSDVFAGDFWKLVESPYQPVPGAWVED